MIKLYIWYICFTFWNSSFQFVHTYSWYSDLSNVLAVILPEPDASFSLGSRWAWEIMPENQFVAPHKNTCTWCIGVWLSINTHMAEPWMDACAIWKRVFHKYVHCFVGCVLPYLIVVHGPLDRYVKLRFAHAPGMPGTFSPPPRVSDPDMHHGTCVTHVPCCMSGSLTIGFLWIQWRGKRSRHSRRMRNLQLDISGKRPMLVMGNSKSHLSQ